jgi:hypothetical protein
VGLVRSCSRAQQASRVQLLTVCGAAEEVGADDMSTRLLDTGSGEFRVPRKSTASEVYLPSLVVFSGGTAFNSIAGGRTAAALRVLAFMQQHRMEKSTTLQLGLLPALHTSSLAASVHHHQHRPDPSSPQPLQCSFPSLAAPQPTSAS